MILLTGATGFLGSRILHSLLRQNKEVIVLKRSFSNTKRIESFLSDCKVYDIDKTSVKKIFEESKVETIIHTAANYGRNGELLQEIAEANLYFPLELLSFAIQHHVKTFINTGTSLPPGINAYSLSKKQFTDWLKMHCDRLCVLNVELQYFYGEGDDEWKLIPMILRKLIDREPKIDFTSGNQQRDFIYIDDVVSAFNVLIQQTSPNGFYQYDLGTGETYSIKQVAAMCKEVVGNNVTKLNFGALPERKNEIEISAADTSGLKGLGWNTSFDLQEGLKQMVNQLVTQIS